MSNNTEFNIDSIRSQFPILKEKVNGKQIIYLDNAASSQKPQIVIDAIANYYNTINANVHRGIHTLSQKATIKMEDSREIMRKFINAKKSEEVIFTAGTTDGINLVAYALRSKLKKGDEICITQMDHHSNIVPWQLLCEFTGAKIRYLPITDKGTLDLSQIDSLINNRTKLVAFSHVSNALGTVNPVQEIIKKAKSVGALVLLDGAQSVCHTPIDVQTLGCDFFVFSGHKMYGPTGTGVLYGKAEVLADLEPYRGGGEMIETVTMEKSTYAGLPFKYEAGTPNICGNIVLGVAAAFMMNIGIENIQKHEKQLLEYATTKLQEVDDIIIYAKEADRNGAVSFNINLPNVHPSDIGMVLDKQGIAVRTGHHCCQPIMSYFDILGTVRASFGIYNTTEEIDKLVDAVKLAHRLFS